MPAGERQGICEMPPRVQMARGTPEESSKGGRGQMPKSDENKKKSGTQLHLLPLPLRGAEFSAETSVADGSFGKRFANKSL